DQRGRPRPRPSHPARSRQSAAPLAAICKSKRLTLESPMAEMEKVLQTVAWKGGRVRLIDQTALPERLAYVDYNDWRDVAQAIRTMVVRGAPAIGCAAALGMALGARGIIAENKAAFHKRMSQMAET